ncbi:MAG: sigma-54 dependent transcriptional regulator [Desulfobacterales bacterium]|nr:sigma-54 dependent transcriptional regulator [Desulfobacterales bacterium]
MAIERIDSKILIVDDSEATREVLQRNLRALNYAVFTASGVAEALNILGSSKIDLVITDVKMPKVSGLELVRHVRENFMDTQVIVVTGYPNVDGAITAIKHGAVDYITKPFTDVELQDAVHKALEKVQSKRYQSRDLRSIGRHGILGESKAIKKVLSEIEKAARSNATVLITGESGTGKELVARGIHYESKRAASPFVSVNCGAIPEQLLESELFGHMKGSFTGASESRAGFFIVADKGSLFLDEIGETSMTLQVKLLRVLQEKELCMVGSSHPRKIDVRIIAATNKDLSLLVQKQTFREDLFFRLNVITIDLPPLRDRDSDIILLTHHFAAKFANEYERPIPKFTDHAIEILRNYAWPGNIRELENIIQRIIVMTEGDVVDTPNLPSLMRFSANCGMVDLNRTLVEVENSYIRDVMNAVNGNKTKAAQILDIDRKTLRNKLAQYPEKK